MQTPACIAVVGTGLLGGSIGLGLRAAGFGGRIIGVGRRNETLDQARQRGCIDEGTTDLAAATTACQLLVLAAPLRELEALLVTVAGAQHADLTITDVGSVKAAVCRAAARTLSDPSRFVGAHPMAGSEKQGPQNARADLFRGRPCILVPGGAAAEAVGAVRWLWETLGMRLLYMGEEEHDRKVAAISHLPHATAAALLHSAARADALPVASSGFADLTRVASGDPQLWADILLANTAAVGEGINDLGRTLKDLAEALGRGDRERLVALLRVAKETRDGWLRDQALPPASEPI